MDTKSYAKQTLECAKTLDEYLRLVIHPRPEDRLVKVLCDLQKPRQCLKYSLENRTLGEEQLLFLKKVNKRITTAETIVQTLWDKYIGRDRISNNQKNLKELYTLMTERELAIPTGEHIYGEKGIITINFYLPEGTAKIETDSSQKESTTTKTPIFNKNSRGHIIDQHDSILLVDGQNIDKVLNYTLRRVKNLKNDTGVKTEIIFGEEMPIEYHSYPLDAMCVSIQTNGKEGIDYAAIQQPEKHRELRFIQDHELYHAIQYHLSFHQRQLLREFSATLFAGKLAPRELKRDAQTIIELKENIEARIKRKIGYREERHAKLQKYRAPKEIIYETEKLIKKGYKELNMFSKIDAAKIAEQIRAFPFDLVKNIIEKGVSRRAVSHIISMTDFFELVPTLESINDYLKK